ncbi:hypothetical protein [Alteromonas antoniana]|uniref:hypothetical protein n=1 Tax=Alteromonas antoniana TaxID=2803813 RepID=UPI001C488FDD|nr:hypothetical protein [Alteromonas antoniana]
MNLLTTLSRISSESNLNNPEESLKSLLNGLQGCFAADECIFVKELSNELAPVFIEDDKYFQMSECRSTLETLLHRFANSVYEELAVRENEDLVFNGKTVKDWQIIKIAEPAGLIGYIVLLSYFHNLNPSRFQIISAPLMVKR